MQLILGIVLSVIVALVALFVVKIVFDKGLPFLLAIVTWIAFLIVFLVLCGLLGVDGTFGFITYFLIIIAGSKFLANG